MQIRFQGHPQNPRKVSVILMHVVVKLEMCAERHCKQPLLMMRATERSLTLVLIEPQQSTALKFLFFRYLHLWTSQPCRIQLKRDGTRWRTGGEVKGKLANGVGSQYSSHYLGTWCIQHYYCSQRGLIRPRWRKVVASLRNMTCTSGCSYSFVYSWWWVWWTTETCRVILQEINTCILLHPVGSY